MLFDLTVVDLSVIITTIANVFLWVTTWQTLKLLTQQVEHQIAESYCQTQSQVIEAHRNIFLGIFSNQAMLEGFCRANKLDPEKWGGQKASEFLINQVLVGYSGFANGFISTADFEGFKRDAIDVFQYPSVREHWTSVRAVHSEEFRKFVESELMWGEEKGAVKKLLVG